MEKKLKTYELKTEYGKYKIAPALEHYTTFNSLAIELWDVKECEPFATLTVNLPESVECEPCEAFVDTNNCSWAEKFIKQHQLGEPTGHYGYSGFCKYPLYKFDLNKLNNNLEDKLGW